MRIPLTKYGLPQVVVYPAAVLAVMVVFAPVTAVLLPDWVVIAIETFLAGVLIWALMFFRDPGRSCPADINLLLAPADGHITEIETIEEASFIKGPALRIGNRGVNLAGSQIEKTVRLGQLVFKGNRQRLPVQLQLCPRLLIALIPYALVEHIVVVHIITPRPSLGPRCCRLIRDWQSYCT